MKNPKSELRTQNPGTAQAGHAVLCAPPAGLGVVVLRCGAHGVTRPTSRNLIHARVAGPCAVAVGLLLSVCCFSAFAQSYSIPWYTIDGGGGTSTGGVYRVSGTIGQSDAGRRMTNGQYAVTGGFWALPQAVQTEGAPKLTIARAAPGFVIISWSPATGANWVLQERLSLTTGAWTNSPSGSTNPVTVPATLPAKFYRLFKL